MTIENILSTEIQANIDITFEKTPCHSEYKLIIISLYLLLLI